MARKSEKIKILFTIPDFDTAGSGKALLKIATRLNPSLFEPHIACMHNRGAFFKVVEESGIPVHVFQYTTPMKPYHKGVYNCIKIAKEFRSIKPDIIHSFHYNADYSEALAAKFAGIKWLYSKKNMSWGGSSKNSWHMRTLLASHVIYQNTDMKEQFFSTLKNTTFIPRGVDVAEFNQAAPRKELLEKYGLSLQDRIVIVVANLVPLKGIDVLIKAYNQEEIYNNKWKLLIVGDDKNEYGDTLKELVTKLDLTSKIIFTGKVLNVNEHLNLAELFVLPTVFKGEGSPVALLEAMATGLCVLGSNLPGIRDQLQSNPNHMVEAGDVSAWKKTLLYFLNKSPKQLKEIGELFYKEVRDNYQINNEVSKTEKVYKKIG